MCRIDLGIDKITDRHGRCLGSRLELIDSSIGQNRTELLVHAVNSLAGGQNRRKGKLVVPVSMLEDDGQLVKTMAGLSKNLRQSVVVEAHAGQGGLSAVAVTQLRGLRTMLKLNLALSTDGYEVDDLKRDIRALDPEIVVIDQMLARNMIRTRRRELLLDTGELCAKRGGRVAIAGEFSDGDQSWLGDAGADVFIGHRFGVRINCEETLAMETSRKVCSEQKSSQLDGLMNRLGVRTMMSVD